MKRLVDRFEADASACAHLAELKAVVSKACFDLGFDHFAILHHASLATSSTGLLRIDNYPEAWVGEILRTKLSRDDPVHLASRRAGNPFTWSELSQIIALEARHRTILERSRQFGLGDGFTVPVNVPGEPAGSCSFVVGAGRELPSSRLLYAELIGSRAFRAARRIAGTRPALPRPRLSRREIQCLRLVALGKTNWETAQILGIGIETARHYVKRLRAAYDVTTRAQLVALALRDDWTTFEEAAPLTRAMKPRQG